MIPRAFCPELGNIQPELEKLLLCHLKLDGRISQVHGPEDAGETREDSPVT